MSNDRGQFRFFDLPRELRDHVYSYLLGQHFSSDTIIEGCKTRYPQLIISNIPRLSLLLSNKQLAHEYKQSLPRGQTLTLYDPFHYLYGRAQLPQTLPRSWVNITTVVAAFSVYDFWENTEAAHALHGQCEVPDRINDHAEYIEKHLCSKLPRLESVRFRISLVWQCAQHYEWPRHYHSEKLNRRLEQLVEMRKEVKACDIVLHDENDDWIEHEHYWTPGAFEQDAWATWSKEDGWRTGRTPKYPFPKTNDR